MLTFLTKTVIEGQLVIFDPSENINYISSSYIEAMLSLGSRWIQRVDNFFYFLQVESAPL